MWLYISYCIVCAAASIVLLCGALLVRLSEKAAVRRERRFARQYMQMITHRLLEREAIPMAGFPMSDSRGAREVLARLLAAASSSTFFEEPGAVRRMVAANGIEGWLLRRVKHSRGYRRTHYLALLSALPVSHATAECIRRCTAGTDRHTLFRTMLVGIAADPQSAVQLLSGYPYDMTPLEMAELTSMLRRGLLPLAYAPLLASPNRNLKMLGLNIVRIFGIAESECRLLELVAAGGPSADEVRCEALHIIVSLHLPVSRSPVADCIRVMGAADRRALFRHLASEGYSVETIARLARDDEQPYVESLTASYKRTLVCHSPM